MHLPEYRSSRPPKCHQKWFLLASILLSGLPSAFGDDAGVRAAASPPSRPYRFASGRASLQIPFEEDDGHIFVKLRVNDSGPLSFAVDTGAIRSVIDTERARALGLRVEGSQPVGGAAGIERAGTVKGVSIKLPGVELVDQTLWTLPLAAIAAVQGRPIDGILGYDLFRDLVIDIDYEHERLDVSDASGYVYRGPGESIPFTVIEDSIYVRGKVTSGTGLEAEGDFIVDTGGNVTLMLARSFVDEHRLAPPVESVIRAGGLGVGGTIKVTIGRVKKFQIGRFVVNEPVTAFVETGEIAERGKAGNIGARLLRRFRVVFDYTRRRMILEPNAYAIEPEDFDMSGVALASQAPDFRTIKVARIRPGSPGARAGLEQEDVILGVEGQASELSVRRLKLLFRKEGRQYVLLVKRGAQALRLTMKTRKTL